MPRLRLVLLAAAVALLSGCADLQTEQLKEDPGDLPPRSQVAGVPFYPQQAHYCGPASLAMVLSWAGAEATQDDVAGQVFTPQKEGAFRADVIAAARRRGYLAVPVRGIPELFAELAGDHPVLVFQNLGLSWLPQWHFAVAIGYDLPGGEIRLHTGEHRARGVALGTFERTWARTNYWGVVVLPPDRLPATKGAGRVLEAVVGLEKAERFRSAAAAYAAATRRWPGELGGWVGLANARYRLGDLRGAVDALQAALAHHPLAADAWNNLAVVLAELGQRRAALEAASRAVSTGGDRYATYRQTLREVVGSPKDEEGRKDGQSP
ncbi:PA2778 family cysteine peptidase [Thiohalorhabdus sp.]|uniref:PA2778 family cysteine peptidase n=1 Tax=Thiohalorhabdus sp. TaxID=3094134 RepID=UPI002FC2F991